MSDVNILPLRNIVIASIFLSVLSLLIFGQGLAGQDSENGSLVVTTTTETSSTTSTTAETSSTTSTSAETQTTTIAHNATTPVIASETEGENFDAQEDVSATQDPLLDVDYTLVEEGQVSSQAEANAARIRFGEFEIDTFKELAVVMAGIVGFTLLFLGLFAGGFALVFNTDEVRTYINQGLKLSGFKQAVKSIGKTWLLDESGIKMSLLGVKNPKVEIRLPRLGDPDEFGFQEVGTMVKTTCTLDMLPLKLQAIRLYLSQFKNS